MKKRMIVLIMIMAMILPLTACGSGGLSLLFSRKKEYRTFEEIKLAAKEQVKYSLQDLESQYGTIKKKIDKGFEGYSKSVEDIDDWYNRILIEGEALRDMLSDANAAYYRLIAEEGIRIYESWSADMSSCFDMWDSTLEDFYGSCDELLEEAYEMLDSVLEDAFAILGPETVAASWEDMSNRYTDARSRLNGQRSDVWTYLNDRHTCVLQGFSGGETDVAALLTRAGDNTGTTEAAAGNETGASVEAGTSGESETEPASGEDSYTTVETVGKTLLDTTVAKLQESLDHLKAEMGGTYEGFQNCADGIEAWYALCRSEGDAFYSALYYANAAFYLAIADAEYLQYSVWSEGMDRCYGMWDSIMGDFFSAWDQMYTELFNSLERVMLEAPDAPGKEEVSATWMSVYDQHSDEWSTMYDMHADAWRFLYDRHLRVVREFRDGNQDIETLLNEGLNGNSSTEKADGSKQDNSGNGNQNSGASGADDWSPSGSSSVKRNTNSSKSGKQNSNGSKSGNLNSGGAKTDASETDDSDQEASDSDDGKSGKSQKNDADSGNSKTGEAESDDGEEKTRAEKRAERKAERQKNKETKESKETGESEETKASKETGETKETTASAEEDSGRISDRLQSFLDDYEDFIDEYIAIKKKFDKNPDDEETQKDYAYYSGKYAQWLVKMEKWEKENLNATESEYLNTVKRRTSEKLLTAFH